MSAPFGHFLIVLSPRTDDRLRYCTNSGPNPSKFYIPDRLEQLTTLDDEHTKSFYAPSVPIASPQMQKAIYSVFYKRVYPVSMRRHSKSARRKLASPSLFICLDWEHFVLVPASVYNKSATTQSVTKQELPNIKLNNLPHTKLIL